MDSSWAGTKTNTDRAYVHNMLISAKLRRVDLESELSPIG